MKRQLDEVRIHCGPHPCLHDEAKELPLTWRYSVVSRDYVLSLCVSKSGGTFVLHMAMGSCESADFRCFYDCDLLGKCEVPSEFHIVSPITLSASTPQLVSPPQVSPALMFWSQHAIQGRREQPERFWRALERRARDLAKEARKGVHRTLCPRCQGTGAIVVKPRTAKKAG